VPMRESKQLDVTDVVHVLRHGRWWVLAGFLLGALVGGVIVIVRTPIYRAEVLIQPIKNSGGGGAMEALAGQLGGLASLAGVDLTGAEDTAAAVATLKSHQLVSSYIAEMNLLPVLYAKRWDAQTGRWKTSDPDEVPTVWSGERLFSKEIRNVTENRSSGLVTLTIDWKDAAVAARWANDLVARADRALRNDARDRAQRNIAFIEKQLQSTTIVEVRNSLSSMLQGQWNKLMLSEGDSEYAFRVIDPAVVPKREANLPKSVTILLSMVGGMMVGFAVAFGRMIAWAPVAANEGRS
jgi:uncharacterized protein involved in exopolysaccharide biosynthesis